MKNLDRNLNPELLQILNGFTDWWFKNDLSKVKIVGKPDTNEYATSQEYLNTIQKDVHIGYPETTHGADILIAGSTPQEWRDKIVETNKELNSYLNTKFCAVNMYYPAGGYMGWHNNHNCPGYNVLLTYNTDLYGGFFRYIDPKSKNAMTMYDRRGWSAKVGYYGHLGEPDKVYWHCARAYTPRLTFGYVVPDEDMWHMMIEAL